MLLKTWQQDSLFSTKDGFRVLRSHFCGEPTDRVSTNFRLDQIRNRIETYRKSRVLPADGGTLTLTELNQKRIRLELHRGGAWPALFAAAASIPSTFAAAHSRNQRLRNRGSSLVRTALTSMLGEDL